VVGVSLFLSCNNGVLVGCGIIYPFISFKSSPVYLFSSLFSSVLTVGSDDLEP